ncbi:MAG: hypothetical protein HY600_05010, partial [Candidatus Omnitrophica bacterium]|nr:hypothetical protein [Candidatus Omnitrophota bacterium]
MRRMRRWAWAMLLAIGGAGTPAWAMNVDRLDEAEVQQLEIVLQQLGPLIDRRRAKGTLPLMTFQELYVPLAYPQRAFLDALRAVSPESLGGSSRRLPPPSPYEAFVRIDGQIVQQHGEAETLHPEFLPRPVFDAYQRMMRAMQRDLGRRLFVESGYRSPAHQLYLFCFY